MRLVGFPDQEFLFEVIIEHGQRAPCFFVLRAHVGQRHNAARLSGAGFNERSFMTLFSRALKSWLAVAMLFVASWALALPTPKEIESAVNAGQYTQAESMLREVLQAKPQSAKAHYELGQVLAHVERYKEAQVALQKAKDIDPTLKFASSPEKFNTVLAKVTELAAAPSSSVVMAPSVAPGTHAATQANPVAAPAANGGGFSLTYVWLAIAGLVVLGLWLRRSAAVNASTGTPVAPAPVQRGFGAQYTPNAASGAYAPQGYAQPNTGGSTMTGAVVGGLAGVAAGYALSKALEGDHGASGAGSAPSSAAAAGQGGYVPFDAPAQPDLGTFDAGSGNDWDSADSVGGSDDSW